MSYRFKRRSFLASLGGAAGLHTMLRNLEAAEVGTPSPPRLLAAHWPLGTMQYHYLPTGGRRDFETSRILKPFEELGLREDLVILFGLTHDGMISSSGGGHEAGTVMMMTGTGTTATRDNGGEADDSIANGPSFDQIFLKHARALATLGKGYANAIADTRVDSHETSTQCLSYSHQTREIMSARPGGTVIENTPLLPKLNPIDLYTELFDGFVPGGADREQMIRDLRLKKSVLDGSLRQLSRLGDLAPASERAKIEVHTEAIRKLEQQLSNALGESGWCEPPTAPDPAIQGKTGSQIVYNNPEVEEADEGLVEQIGKLHLGTILVAFQCDLIRVATFQWAPGQTQVSFEGLDPTRPSTNYIHHPMSHRVALPSFFSGPPPDENANIYEILVNANTWYFRKYAEVFAGWKTATDAFGGSLLDHTVIPLVTEVDNGSHSRSRLPALILGGRALGLQGGQFLDFQSDARPHNDLWMTVAQAFFPNSPDVLAEMPDEVFFRDSVAPIEGVWERPA